MTGLTSSLLHYAALPAHWVADTLNLPAILPWAPYIAILFIFASLTLAWWSLLFWRQHKFHFYFLLYLFLLGLGVIGYFTIILIPLLWVYGGLVALVGFLLAWRLVGRPGLDRA